MKDDGILSFRNPVKEQCSEDPSKAGLSFLELVMLHLLDEGPTTGYDLKKRLTTQFHLRASYGTLYPALRDFEKEGVLRVVPPSEQIVPKSSGICYELTQKGKEIFSNELRTFSGFFEKIRATEQKSTDPVEIKT
jgi:DNA-binding PadR family transcriptional regulator